MITPEVKGKRSVNEDSNKASSGAEHRNPLKEALVAASAGKETLSKIRSRAERRGQNNT